MTIPFAHETWFDHAVYPTDWGFAAEKLTLTLLVLALAATVLVRLLARVAPGIDVPALGRLAPFMPFAIRLHLAVSLVGLLSLGFYLSPAMDLQADFAGIALGASMGVVAITMATGWHARAGAAVLIALGPLGMIEFGFWRCSSGSTCSAWPSTCSPPGPAAGLPTSRPAAPPSRPCSTTPARSGRCGWRPASR
jgi:hypothetical protein